MKPHHFSSQFTRLLRESWGRPCNVRVLLVSIIALLTGCIAPPDAGFGSGERSDIEDVPAIPIDTTPLCPSPACPDSECSQDSAVDWQEDPGGERPCPVPGACDLDYLRFLDLASEEGTQISPQELQDTIEALIGGDVDYQTDPVGHEELGAIVIEKTNLGFLLDGLTDRPLVVREVGEQPFGYGRQIDLVLEDPWVGAFQAMLLLPHTESPHPGVVAHPGHWEESWEHRDLRHARDLVHAGIAVGILDARAHEADEIESEVTKAMLLGGHSFMAVRVYETLLLRRVLRAHPEIHPERIGLMGHSGGSASGNLALRVDVDWQAYASDFLAEYLNASPDGSYIDETVPQLHPWFGKINQLSTAPTPSQLFEYGYPEGGEALVSFFCELLGP